MRYYDGIDWTPHVVFSGAERADRLAQAVADAVAMGWRVESQTAYSATLACGQPTNVVAHLLGVMLTCGLWLIVMLIAMGTEKPVQRMTLRVDAQGNVIRA